MALNTRALVLTGAVAGATFFASPAAASAAAIPTAGLGVPSSAIGHSRFDPASTTVDYRCRWGCRRGHHRGYGRGRVGAGDVLIGVAIIGGIAAIANSANRRERDRDVVIVERDTRDGAYNPRYNTRRNDDSRTNNRASSRGSGASGLDNAVDQCLTRIERDVRVDTVDNVDRTGAGWVVNGTLFNGAPFQCRIGNGGQIDAIDYSGDFSRALSSASPDRAGNQWDDQRYADARMAMGGMTRPLVPETAEQRPAYPGGPIPGEIIPETIDSDL